MGCIHKLPVGVVAKENKVARHKVVMTYGQAVVHAVFSLRRRRTGDGYAHLCYAQVGKVAAIGVVALSGLQLAVRVAQPGKGQPDNRRARFAFRQVVVQEARGEAKRTSPCFPLASSCIYPLFNSFHAVWLFVG